MELTRRPSALAPGGDELSGAREFHDAVVPRLAMTIRDKHIADGRNRNVARRREMIRTASLLSGRAERHQHLSVRAELDDDLATLVAFRRAVRGHGIGDPHVALRVDGEPVRPDEHAAAETLHDLAVRTELQYRIGFRVAALVAEARRILEALAAHNGPDVPAIGIDRDLADGAHRTSVRQLRPSFSDAI